MSNYPPGVTGNEFRIAGPDFDDYIDVECPRCETESKDIYAYSFRGVLYWECPTCGHMQETELEPDPDAAYEAWRGWRRA